MKRTHWLLSLAVPVAFASSAIGYTAVARADAQSAGASELPARASDAPAGPQAADGFEAFFTLHGPVGGDSGEDMAVDADGNVFISGGHMGLDTDRDGQIDVPADEADLLFIKLRPDPDGDRVNIEWMQSPSSPGFDFSGQIAPDQRGGVYGVGQFQETLSFSPNVSLASAGAHDGFLVRYGADGESLWARAFGGPAADQLIDVDSDAAGNAYVTGLVSGSFDLDDRGAEFRAAETSSLVISYDLEGAVRWSRVLAAGTASFIKVAPNGDVFVMGSADASVDFDGDGQADLSAPSDRSDGTVARFDGNGEFLTAWSLGAPALSIAFTSDGDVLVLGMLGGPLDEYYGVSDFDGDGAADVEVKGGGPRSAWVARYTPDGALKWVRSYALEVPGDLEVYDDKIVMTGSYKGVRDLDEDGVPEIVDRTVDPSLSSELAILILSDLDGRPERVWIAPGPGNDRAAGAAFLPDRPILYVTGFLQLTADFSGDGEDDEGWARCDALGDFFFAQYRLGETPRIVLTTEGTEISGVGLRADLAWTGASSANVDVYRNGALLETTANDGVYADSIARGSGTRGPFSYRVCEEGTQTCSNSSTPQF